MQTLLLSTRVVLLIFEKLKLKGLTSQCIVTSSWSQRTTKQHFQQNSRPSQSQPLPSSRPRSVAAERLQEADDPAPVPCPARRSRTPAPELPRRPRGQEQGQVFLSSVQVDKLSLLEHRLMIANTIMQLREHCKARGLAVAGSKTELAQRLARKLLL